jgi:hypothetical protein
LTISLRLALAQRFLHPGEPHVARFVGVAKALQAHLLSNIGANAFVFLVQLSLVFMVITPGNREFGGRERGNPAQDFFVGAAIVKYGTKSCTVIRLVDSWGPRPRSTISVVLLIKYRSLRHGCPWIVSET